jgi:hypothetical protein
MTERQENTVVMYHTLDDYLKGISEKLEKVPMYLSIKARFDAHVNGIEEAARLQVTFTKGKTAAKSAAELQLDMTAEAVRSMLHAHALSAGDAELLEKTKAYKREVPAMKRSERLRRTEILYQDAVAEREHVNQFSESDILKVLETTISEVTTTTSVRNHGTAARKTIRKEIASLIAATNTLINVDLKAIFLPYRNSDPKLYTGFEDARKIRATVTRQEKKTETGAANAPQATVENPTPATVLPAVKPAQENPSASE